MHVIAVVNTKGGVGKTTLAAALAVRAAQESKRVAMVDMDPQKSLVEWWARRGRSENPTIFEGADTARDAVEALSLQRLRLGLHRRPASLPESRSGDH